MPPAFAGGVRIVLGRGAPAFSSRSAGVTDEPATLASARTRRPKPTRSVTADVPDTIALPNTSAVREVRVASAYESISPFTRAEITATAHAAAAPTIHQS